MLLYYKGISTFKRFAIPFIFQVKVLCAFAKIHNIKFVYSVG